MKIWSAGDWQCLATLSFAEAATSVASALTPDKRYVLQGLSCQNRLLILFMIQSAYPRSRARERRDPSLLCHAGRDVLLEATSAARLSVSSALGVSPRPELTKKSLPRSWAHVRSVTTLAFSPRVTDAETLRLASGSEDHTVRIFDVPVLDDTNP